MQKKGTAEGSIYEEVERTILNIPRQQNVENVNLNVQGRIFKT